MSANKAARKEIFAAVVNRGFNEAIKRDDEKAHNAFRAGDMDANAKHLAAGDKKRAIRDKVVPPIGIVEGMAFANGPAIAVRAAEMGELKLKKHRDAAVAAHAKTQTGHDKKASPDAQKINDRANMVRLTKNMAKGMDVVNSAIDGAIVIADGAIGAAINGPSTDSLKKAGKAISGAAEGFAAAGMGAVGLAKHAHVMGLKKNSEKNWDKARAAMKDGRLKPGPVPSTIAAPTTTKQRVVIDAMKSVPKKAADCISNCVRAVQNIGKPKSRG
ncbi:hypothetical protein H310_12422 [Aphanomyces invadans]|uniref:Uncharacterized protein n=1 Tax=Aphanomyces invadans TaxID=157072 RepID=A0A024THW1_9STRA|nr:hypothetical protein H310_12422 [Aphanomyces invadans]ETV93653.1 hypothetical protein H310_12422 [Aphanomyces invadans]RHY16988.1 hypothetical protein DYB32_010588 [Aphanomyces invadans]|eukprot:XP_008877694.1 hypothetical protein H310_12422 [Aphanomyces invadans]